MLVDSTPGGPGSKFFEALKVEDKITFIGPFGTFALNQKDDSENLLFLATGAGLAPLKSMIEATLQTDVTKKVYLYLGVNNCEDIFMKDYLDELSNKFTNFKYKISVCNADKTWEGPIGFITSEIKKDFADASKCSAYLCGNKFMIADSTKILVENGCNADKIYFEKYETRN